MSYDYIFHEKCEKELRKACNKNSSLQNALTNKIREIIMNPQHYKPLKYGLAGERRVHIMKSFVLKFEIDEATKTVKFMAFEHHDDAYRR